jgi:hypothetical protein
MKKQKSFLIAVICLFLGFITTISLAQEAQDEFPAEGAGARLVVTSVSGPATAIHGQNISVTYTVKNQGTVVSGAYYVDLYLSTDRTIDPAADRLLKYARFSTGLASGESRKATAKVLVPINGLSGKYYYGAVVATSKKASSKQVSLLRYSLADDNETVTDHKTGLVWQQADDGEQRNWDAAKQYCGDLILGGKTDWRLPSIEELEAIIDYSREYPAIDPLFSCHTDSYWSGSTLAANPEVLVWGLFFYDGSTVWGYKTPNRFVRCVRGGP